MEDISITIKNEEIPVPGLGTYLLSGSDCVKTVEQALSMGYRLIDTARSYGNESEIGIAIKNTNVPRKELFLITKITPQNLKFENVTESTRESLQNLDTDYIDLLLIHWPGSEVPVKETFDAMNKMQKKEHVRHIGVSNFPPSLVDEAMQHTKIFANEVEYHPYLVREYLKDHAEINNYLTIAYSPLAKAGIKEDAVIREIGKNHGKTPVQVTLRWLLQEGIVPIPKASQTQHLEENMNIFDFTLSEDEKIAIRDLDRDWHLDPVSDMADEE